jgi:hypothetical protein
MGHPVKFFSMNARKSLQTIARFLALIFSGGLFFWLIGGLLMNPVASYRKDLALWLIGLVYFGGLITGFHRPGIGGLISLISCLIMFLMVIILYLPIGNAEAMIWIVLVMLIPAILLLPSWYFNRRKKNPDVGQHC